MRIKMHNTAILGVIVIMICACTNRLLESVTFTPSDTISLTPAEVPVTDSPSVFSNNIGTLPSGQYVAFSYLNDIHVTSIDGSIQTEYAQNAGIAVSPNGKRITDGYFIYEIGIDDAQDVSFIADMGCSFWGGSPDGIQLSVLCNQSSELYALSLEHRTTVLINDSSVGYTHIQAPTWSPDGKWISYVNNAYDNPPENQLFLVNASCLTMTPVACSEQTRGPIAGNFYFGFIPYGWSPDSRYIAIPGLGNSEILIYDIQNDFVKPIYVGGDNRIASVAWSPDGSWLAYSQKSEGDDAYQVYIVSLSGGNAIKITEDSVDKYVLFWIHLP